MKFEIKSVSPARLAKVFAVFYGAIGLLVTPVMMLNALFLPGGFGARLGALLLTLFYPILYVLVGVIVGLVSAFLYNLIVPWVGGIEMEVEQKGSTPSALGDQHPDSLH